MSPDKGGKTNDSARRARLAASLRENLKRRKTQQRSRAAETSSAASDSDTASASREAKG